MTMYSDTEQGYDDPVAADPEPDRRIIAVQRLVELEREHERAVLDAEQRQKKAAILGEELRQARDELAGLLGYPSNAGAKAMDSATARAIAAERFAR